MADTTFRTVFPDLKAVDNGDGTYSVAVSIPGMPPLTGLTAGELLVALTATTAGWQNSGVTLTSPTINGTIATTGLTLPAVTLGGTLNANANGITNLAYARGSDSDTLFLGHHPSTGPYLYFAGKDHAGNGEVYLATPNAAENAPVNRLHITGALATAVATWASITHTGLVLSGALDAAANYMSFTEMGAPGAGAANTARVYAVVGGDTLTDLAAVFQDGTVDIFAQEVTPLDAPTFTYPSGTGVTTVLRKEHPGLVKIVSVFPDGKEFVLKEIQYHDPEKIAANKGTENPLPSDWLVEDAAQRAERLEAERIENVVLPQAELAK